ncbi:MAG: hypothetical protein WBG28_06635 [Desulfobulbales bacterium]|nr:hypothetical protein [Desulfobacteraceae bacterium]
MPTTRQTKCLGPSVWVRGKKIDTIKRNLEIIGEAVKIFQPTEKTK